MTIGQRIKKTREAMDVTQEYVAKLVGVAVQTIFKYENEIITNIPLDKLEKIAKALDTSPAYLMGWEEKKSPEPDIPIENMENYVPYKPSKVPFLGDISCGQPIYANQEYNSYVISDKGIDADFCLRAKGNSMINAGINENDIVFIKKQAFIDNGSIVAVAIDDTVTLKRFYQTENTVTLVSENPAYAPMIYDVSDGYSVYILGKAMAVQKPLL